MRVVINQKHLSLNEKLARELNKLIRKFNIKNYSKIENIDNILLKRDVSVEKKKGALIEKLHEAIVKAFSINKKSFNKKTFDLLKKKIYNIRKIILKLRSINYYLETTFLEELKLSKIRINYSTKKIRQQDFVGDELDELEYTAYKLIGEVVSLDKSLLKEYSHKEERILKKEKIEIKDLELILREESTLLEHLEAKLPPPKSADIALIKEPTFTHWVARILALLTCLEHIYAKEVIVFNKLKKNKIIKSKINKKIIHLIKEKSKLIKIMEEKSISMKKFRLSNELKKESHYLTTIIGL